MLETNDLTRNANATVLVVEDDPPLLEFFSALLQREGYRILVAVNGVEALDVASSSPNKRIDILLSDVAMPYMGGILLAERLMEIRPDIQVILTSALPHQEVLNSDSALLPSTRVKIMIRRRRIRGGQSFNAEFLPKPFSVFDLSERIGRLAKAA